ncbi:MAG: HD domain-containing protein [Terrimonas ferruginea]|uniref:HD domain-containing protein n=1 Tax=Terrimonas ferruginea TaxID=249 RepID=UPI000A7D3F7C|nr:HD domain-containing protein [Terrimonas ferruginea]MBN8785160.1 HD domain-containing protein [Terrimonas ferruginea]
MNDYIPVFGSAFLQRAELIAVEAHGSQKRQFEEAPYWRHLQRVAETVLRYSDNESLTAAALFHDILEDTSWSEQQLKEKISVISSPQHAGLILGWVKELTDQFIKSNYPDWNRKRRKQAEAERLSNVSSEAQTVKYADIMDNSQSLRTGGQSFAPKYLSEALHLLQVMTKGNTALRAEALEVVTQEMTRLNITIPSR